MKEYKDLLAAGLEETYQATLTSLPNEENIPESFRVEEARRTKEELGRRLRGTRDEEEKRMLRHLLSQAEHRQDMKPVPLEEYNAALLMRFVVQVRQGGEVDRATVEFISHVLEDVLAGASFDSVCPLPGRDRRKPSERTKQKNREMVQWMEHALEGGQFSSVPEAAEAAASLWSVGIDTARKLYYELKGQLNCNMSSPEN